MATHIRKLVLATALVTLLIPCEAQKQTTLHSQMKPLSVMIGTWNVNTEIIERSGKKTAESGTYVCTWQLDSTYLQIDATLKPSGGASRKFKCLITYSGQKAAYAVKYFYSGTAFTVDETGLYDATTQTFSTKGTLNINGKNENIRTSLNMSNPDAMKFLSWATFEGDSSEFLDFTAELRRVD